jgi:two-component system LytT family response regulator
MNASAPLRIVVVDDEMLARQVLKEHLQTRGDLQIVAECANGFEAVKAITELQPDLVLLDIQMPKLDGFEVLELVGRQVPVIFVTAYDEFAVRAFEIHAIDYLLKPFSAERINDAVDRARARLRSPQSSQSSQPGPDAAAAVPAPATAVPPLTPITPQQLRAEAKPPAGPLERVLIRDGSKVHVIPVDDVDFVQAQDDYVCFHAGGKQYLKEQPLAEVEAALDPARFVRIHRSFLLNVDRLARVEPLTKDSRIAILKDGRKLPLSRAGYQRLNALL